MWGVRKASLRRDGPEAMVLANHCTSRRFRQQEPDCSCVAPVQIVGHMQDSSSPPDDEAPAIQQLELCRAEGASKPASPHRTTSHRRGRTHTEGQQHRLELPSAQAR